MKARVKEHKMKVQDRVRMNIEQEMEFKRLTVNLIAFCMLYIITLAANLITQGNVNSLGAMGTVRVLVLSLSTVAGYASLIQMNHKPMKSALLLFISQWLRIVLNLIGGKTIEGALVAEGVFDVYSWFVIPILAVVTYKQFIKRYEHNIKNWNFGTKAKKFMNYERLPFKLPTIFQLTFIFLMLTMIFTVANGETLRIILKLDEKNMEASEVTITLLYMAAIAVVPSILTFVRYTMTTLVYWVYGAYIALSIANVIVLAVKGDLLVGYIVNLVIETFILLYVIKDYAMLKRADKVKERSA